ncbi:MAG: outer membrane beta-barrel protein [Bacteroidales bacterium]|nr:outer membrane beta-barrel protein [Bacteroidales bacterium]MBN2698319.1 outer membrane beta-barrel protein [Bacteroidales bacterium]
MNEKQHNEFTNLREKLGGYRVDPPDGVWDAIDSALSRKGKRRVLMILMASAASIALLVSVGLMFRDPGGHYPAEITEEAGVAEEPVSTEKTETVEPGQFVVPDIALREPGKQAFRQKEDPTAEAPVCSGRFERKVEAALEEVVRKQDPEREHLAVVAGEEQGVRSIPEDTVRLEALTPETVITAEPRATDTVLQFIEEGGESVHIAEAEPLEQEKGSRDPRWIVSGDLSPLYSYRVTEGELNGSASPEGVESAMMAYAGGIRVGFRPGSRFTIESGILYNKMGIRFGEISGPSIFPEAMNFSPIRGDQVDATVVTVSNSIGNIVTYDGDIFLNNYKSSKFYGFNAIDAPTEYNSRILYDDMKQNLQYLEVPLHMRYTVIDRDIELQLIGGVSTNFLVGNSVTVHTPNGIEEIGYLSNLRTVSYSGNAGIGMIYNFHTRFSISVEPRLRYYLGSVNDQTLPDTKPYSVGIYTGINVRF